LELLRQAGRGGSNPTAWSIGNGQFRVAKKKENLWSSQESSMSDSPDLKDKMAAAAVTGAGASVGGAGGATVGVLELAARGMATGLLAGVVIGVGAAVGAVFAYGAYRLFRKRNLSRHQNAPDADR
jgi:uncharacterized membrane protein YebE (DUF533 family)